MSYVQLTSEERYVIYHLKLLRLETSGSGLALTHHLLAIPRVYQPPRRALRRAFSTQENAEFSGCRPSFRQPVPDSH